MCEESGYREFRRLNESDRIECKGPDNPTETLDPPSPEIDVVPKITHHSGDSACRNRIMGNLCALGRTAQRSVRPYLFPHLRVSVLNDTLDLGFADQASKRM